MVRITLLLLSVVLYHSVVNATDCCKGNSCTCEPNCWEQCFMDPPTGTGNTEERHAYLAIYKVVKGIRSLYAPCFKPHGTAYMLDSDVPEINGFSQADVYLYQRILASIVGQTQAVGDDCNPFCTSKYFRNFAYYSHSWPCKSRCEIYNFFTNGFTHHITSPNPAIPSWVGGGEILARLCFDRPQLNGHECMKCSDNELLLSFPNNEITSVPSPNCGTNYYCAAIGVGAAGLNNMYAWTNSGPFYKLPLSQAYLTAARKINTCIYERCCKQGQPNNWWETPFPREIRRESEKNVFSFLRPGSKKVEEFKGSFDDFNRKVLTPRTGVVKNERFG